MRTVPNLAENDSYGQVGEALTAGLGPDHPEMAAFVDDVAAFAADHDVALDVPATFDVTEALNLVFVPREFQPAGDSFDHRVQFLGPMVGHRAETQPWSPSDSQRPVLYVSLGSIFTDHPEFYRTCLDAFGDGHWQVAMTVGQTDPAALDSVSTTVHARPWFLQPAVLAHAAAFVPHAGMNSTVEALSCGVPLVTLPQMPEQDVNAERIEQLGLGQRLNPETVTAETLRAAVDEVTASADTPANLEWMRRAIARSGGAARWSRVDRGSPRPRRNVIDADPDRLSPLSHSNHTLIQHGHTLINSDQHNRDQIVADSPGREVIDVGCGTGIAARQLRAAGCTVLGVEPDARMAEFARHHVGIDVEAKTFEDWQPGSRLYDAVVAGTAWHWLDPTAGAAKAAQALRPGGLLAVFGNVAELPRHVQDAFAAVFRRVAPDSPFTASSALGRSAADAYEQLYAKAADGIRRSGKFADPRQQRFDRQHTYTRDEWLDQLPIQGSLTRLPADDLGQILDSVGAAIDQLGGSFTVTYTAVAVTAAQIAAT